MEVPFSLPSRTATERKKSQIHTESYWNCQGFRSNYNEFGYSSAGEQPISCVPTGDQLKAQH